MLVLETSNAHQVLPHALLALVTKGIPRESRAGDVLVYPEPVTTLYHRPYQRAMFHRLRDANPFFHVMEALWMLDGRSDAEWISTYNGNIAQFAEDDGKFHGAYGERWRLWFDSDQLDEIVGRLRENKNCRRQVLTMWDPRTDLGADKRDLPCNTQVYVSIGHDDRLDITVCCRSNDVVWGCYGSDSATFGFLHEYLARRVGKFVGRYWQVSNNWHGYRKTLDPLLPLINSIQRSDPYKINEEVWRHVPIIEGTDARFRDELRMFMAQGHKAMGYREPFLRSVASPMATAWEKFKEKDYDGAITAAKAIAADDWMVACVDWLRRKKEKWETRSRS